MRGFLISLLLVATVIAGCLGGDRGDAGGSAPLPGDGPLLAFTHIHHPDEIVERIEAFAQRPGVTVQHIGDSVQGRPLHLVSVGEGPFALWIQGRIHGNEPTGAEAILLAMEALTSPDAIVPDDAPEAFRQFFLLRDELLARITFHFVPVANPDGAAAYQRGNVAGQDLNREFFLFTQPEAVVVREAFWSVRPDACLDLHNMGVGQTDWDAYNPDGPLIEPEVFDLMIRDVWTTLYEIDASGGRGGGPNEFYNLLQDAPVVGPIVNPTAFHPGTHDMFCSTRGAPGYTPEGAIRGGGNGATDDIFAWSTRLHQVTIAAAAFHWAGFYQAAELVVQKHEGMMGTTPASHAFEMPGEGELLAQVVWRTQDLVHDYSGPTVVFTVAHGSTGPLPDRDSPLRTMRWTQTVHADTAAAGDYVATVMNVVPVPMPYEVRFVARIPGEPLVHVERSGQDIQIVAHHDVRLRVTDVYAPPDHAVTDFAPDALYVHAHNGTVDARVVVAWEVELVAGQTQLLTGPEGRQGIGPYRFTAVAQDGRVHMGVEPVRNAPPGAWMDGPPAGA